MVDWVSETDECVVVNAWLDEACCMSNEDETDPMASAEAVALALDLESVSPAFL
jgi:hypothetical protein